MTLADIEPTLFRMRLDGQPQREIDALLWTVEHAPEYLPYMTYGPKEDRWVCWLGAKSNAETPEAKFSNWLDDLQSRGGFKL